MVDKAKEYSAGIMTECSWFLEFKKLVFLRHEGLEEKEIRRRCLEENLFGMPNEHRIQRSYGYLSRRVQRMDDELVEVFCNSDLPTQKIINLLTILMGDRLFFEFIYDVYREKIQLGFDCIEASDANTFFRNKAVESEELAAWRDSTFPKVRRCYLNFMTDANLLRKEKNKYIITPPVLDITLERYLQYNGGERYLKAITGVNA